MMKNLRHELGLCWGRGTPCGKQECKQAFLEAFAYGITRAYYLVGECVPNIAATEFYKEADQDE